MTPSEFRKELVKIMPGYNWTVHKPLDKDSSFLEATGIRSSGFNRLSTLGVVRRENEVATTYEVRSSGYGAKAQWLSEALGATLAKALRSLQSHYEVKAATYRSHALALQEARQSKA